MRIARGSMREIARPTSSPTQTAPAPTASGRGRTTGGRYRHTPGQVGHAGHPSVRSVRRRLARRRPWMRASSALSTSSAICSGGWSRPADRSPVPPAAPPPCGDRSPRQAGSTDASDAVGWPVPSGSSICRPRRRAGVMRSPPSARGGRRASRTPARRRCPGRRSRSVCATRRPAPRRFCRVCARPARGRER